MTTIEKLREALIVLTQKITPAHYEDCAYWDDLDGMEDSCNCGQQAALKQGLQALAELDKLKPLSEWELEARAISLFGNPDTSNELGAYWALKKEHWKDGVRAAERRLLGER